MPPRKHQHYLDSEILRAPFLQTQDLTPLQSGQAEPALLDHSERVQLTLLIGLLYLPQKLGATHPQFWQALNQCKRIQSPLVELDYFDDESRLCAAGLLHH